MQSTVQSLFQPYTLPSGVTLANRLVMAPMTHLSYHCGLDNCTFR